MLTNLTGLNFTLFSHTFSYLSDITLERHNNGYTSNKTVKLHTPFTLTQATYFHNIQFFIITGWQFENWCIEKYVV
jgi:hypothetical protein